METAYLHEFAKVADCGSFTAAARELHLTQSTLSKPKAAAPEAPKGPTQEELLADIRDLLKAKA